MMKSLIRISSKILKWLLLTIVAVLLILTGIIYFGAEAYLNKNISKYISDKSNGIYNVNFENIELSFKNRGFDITGLYIEPDMLKAEEIYNQPDKALFSFSSPELQIHKLNLKDLLFEKKINIEKISVENPYFSISGSNMLDLDNEITGNAFIEIKNLFNTYFNEISVSEIEFINAEYQLFNIPGESNRISDAEEISIIISNFRTDSVLLEKAREPYELDDIFIRMNNFKYTMGDSIHSVAIDTIKYSLKKSVLNASSFKLFPQNPTTLKNLYNLYVPEFTLRGSNIFQMHSSDSLSIQFLEFKEPVIQFSQKENIKKIRIEDINNFDLYELIKNEFSSISIDSFYLHNASLEIIRQNKDTSYQQKLAEIDIKLEHFDLDSISQKNPDKLLYANEIEMNITGYELNMDDGIHQFLSDSIFVSTYTNEFEISNINISPLNNKKSYAKISIHCNKISISDVSLKELYHKRKLPSTKIELNRPEVYIDYHKDVPKNTGKGQAGLFFDIVSDYLTGVYSNIIYIQDGTLQIQNFRNNSLTGFIESDFGFILTDFSLDSASISNTDKFFYATNFDLNFSNYHMKLEDQLHQLQVNNIVISSYEASVKVNNLKLSPVRDDITEEDMKLYNRSELYTISIPQINVLNTNLHQAFFNNRLNINKLDFINPSINFENFANLKNEQTEFSELYQIIFNYLYDINIQEINAKDGEINLINHSRNEKTITVNNKFSIELENFHLNEDELDKNRLLFSDHLNFTLKDHLFKLSDNVHYLQAKNFAFSTSDSSITLEDAVLYPDITSPSFSEKPVSFQFTIPYLSLNGVDINNAYFSGNIDVKTLNLNNPKLEIYSQAGKTKSLDLKNLEIPLPNEVNSLNINKLNLNNGKVITYRASGTLNEQSGSFELDLELDQMSILRNNTNENVDLLTNNIISRIHNFEFLFQEGTHKIEADNFTFNKINKNIEINGLRSVPLNNNPDQNQFRITIPYIIFDGLNTDIAYTENKYHFQQININSPDISITRNNINNNTGIKNLYITNLYTYLEPYLNELKISSLTISNADIDLQSSSNDLKHENINIKLDTIEIGENYKNKNLLSSKNFSIETYNISRNSENDKYNFSIDTLLYNSKNKLFLLNHIAINPNYTKDEFARLSIYQVDVLNGQIDYIKLNEPNIEKWINQNQFEAKSLIIGPSNIDIYRDKTLPFNENQKPPWPQELLQSITTPFIIDSVSLMPSSISYSELLETSDSPVTIYFDQLSLNMGKLSNIPEIINQNPILHANAKSTVNKLGEAEVNLIFNLNNPAFQHTVKGSLYPLNLNIFNNITEKTAFLRVNEGRLNRFDFEMSVNNSSATGQLFFGFDDLKVSLIEYDEGRLRKAGFASFMANNFIVNNKNPKGKILEPEIISYQRLPNRSIFNYWWKALFESAKIPIGIKDNEND